MIELYWISRLDAISTLLSFISIFSSIGALVAFIGYWLTARVSKNGECSEKMWEDDYRTAYNFWKKVKNKLLFIALVTIPLSVLCPDTKEAYLIYGIGGTIDYIKQNDVVKQLPDKCIIALDKWLDKNIDNDYNKDSKGSE